MRHQGGRDGEQASPLFGGDVENCYAGQVRIDFKVVEQVPVFGVGQHDLTVHQRDVASQGVAATGGVDATQDVSTQAGGGQGGEHVGGVAHQDAHVQRSPGIGCGDQRGGLRCGLTQVFAPRPRPVAVLDRNPVLLGPFAKKVLQRLRHRRPPPSVE